MPVEAVEASSLTSVVIEADGDATPMLSLERSRVVRTFVWQSLAILLGAAGFAWFVHQMLGDQHSHGNWLLMVLLATASLAAGCWGAISRWRDYSLPIRKLQKIVARIRDGDAAIEELSSIEGGISPVVETVQQLLRDLRQERTRNAVLEAEIRQRVHNRTESLERKIGSLQQQATRDALTGLHNRRLLDQQLPALIEQCKQDYTDMTVLMIDVDYFKTLNDTLGHAAGDQLLRQIAQLIRSTIRENDCAFRCGGDEFVVVMPATSDDTGQRLADRLRSLVDGLGKTLKVSRAPRLSIGLATLHQTNANDAAELLAHADKALYDIKSARSDPARRA
jgi:diguanylate cyclase (GGDEF)-like protein